MNSVLVKIIDGLFGVVVSIFALWGTTFFLDFIDLTFWQSALIVLIVGIVKVVISFVVI